MAGTAIVRSLLSDRLQLLSIGAALVLTALSLLGIHWVVTLAAFAAIALLALINPPIVVAAVIASIPIQSEILLPFVKGELTVTQLTLFGLIAGWGVVFWKRRIWLDAVVVGFMLVLAAYLISFVMVEDTGLWFQETYRWAVAGVFYVICRSVITGRHEIQVAMWAMVPGVLGVSLAGAWQLLAGSGPSDFLVGGAVRVFASFGTPNTLAAYLEMTVPFLLACAGIAWHQRDTERSFQWHIWLLVVACAGGILTIGLTQSRGGWVGIAMSMIILWVLLPMRIRAVSAVVAVILVGGFLMTPPGRSQLDRFGELRTETQLDEATLERSTYDVGAGRGAIWSAAVGMIEDHPLTGVGAGEFDEHHREYSPSWIDRFPRGQAHNVWLQMGAQAGIWGIAAYAWWFFASLWGIITARRRAQSRSAYWVITCVLAVFTAYAFHSLVDYLNVLSLGLQLSILTAIALNLAPEPLTRYASSNNRTMVPTKMEPATWHQ